MLEYILIENTNDSVTYAYYPEKAGKKGLLTVNKNDSSVKSFTLAENDKYRTYLGHLYSNVKMFISTNDYQKNGIIAWG